MDSVANKKKIESYCKNVLINTSPRRQLAKDETTKLASLSSYEPPPLKWSAPIVRKRRTINGHQETQARRDCREVTAG